MIKNSYDAEDITQNVMVKLISCKKGFNDENHRRHWLIRVTINECKSYSRSFWRRFVTGLHGHEKSISFNTPLHSELYDAVMRLPSKYRIGIDFSETVTADQDGTIIS